MPNSHIVHAVVNRIEKISEGSGEKVVDLSCGDGEIAGRLVKMGLEVEGTRYRSDDYIYRDPSPALKEITVHEGVDLTQPLPLPDAGYDWVLATEVLEHLPNHSAVFAEAARILKPGGRFVFTTPNTHRLASRWRFWWTGLHELHGAHLDWSVPADALYSTHHNPIHFPVAHTLAYQQGMRMEILDISKVSVASCLLAVFAPLTFPATWIALRRVRRRSKACGRDLLHWMTRPAMLCSDQLVVVLRKTGTDD